MSLPAQSWGNPPPNHHQNFEVDALGNLHTKCQDDRTTRRGVTANLPHPCLPRRGQISPRRAEFSPIGGPTFGHSSTKLGHSTTKTPPELRNTASLEALHKTPGQLDCSKRPKSPIYYTPIRGSSSTENLGQKSLKYSPSGWWTGIEMCKK